MKTLLLLISTLCFSSFCFSYDAGEAQVLRLSADKKRGIIRLGDFQARNGQVIYLTNSFNKKILSVKVVKVKKRFAIVRSLNGKLNKKVLYEVLDKRPKKKKRRKKLRKRRERKQEVLESQEDSDIEESMDYRRHHLNLGLGLLSPGEGDYFDGGPVLSFSGHIGALVSYKYRAMSGIGFGIEYDFFRGTVESDLVSDIETSSSFSSISGYLEYYFRSGLGVNVGYGTVKSLSSNDIQDETYSGKKFFVGISYQFNLTESLYLKPEFRYNSISYSSVTTTDANGLETEQTLEGAGQTSMYFGAAIGLGF